MVYETSLQPGVRLLLVDQYISAQRTARELYYHTELVEKACGTIHVKGKPRDTTQLGYTLKSEAILNA